MPVSRVALCLGPLVYISVAVCGPPSHSVIAVGGSRGSAAAEHGARRSRLSNLSMPSSLRDEFRFGTWPRTPANAWRDGPRRDRRTLGLSTLPERASDQPDVAQGRWFFDFGITQYWPRLRPSQKLIADRITGPNRLLFPGQFHDVTTFRDARNDGTLLLPFVGVGRDLSDAWSLSGYITGGSRRIDNSQRFNGIVTLRADFKADLFAFGMKASLYPLGRPTGDAVETLSQALTASRFSIDQGFEVEYLDGHGVGEVRVLGIPVSRTSRSYAEWNVSYNPGLSWEMPLGGRWSFLLGASYHFHAYRPTEFDGWNFSASIRLRF